MRVLIWATHYPPRVGGYEHNVERLAQMLAHRDWEVTVVTCNTEGASSTGKSRGVTVLRLPCWQLLGKTYSVPKPSGALWRAWKLRADVSSTQTRFFSLSLIGAAHARRHRMPRVHAERGTCHPVVGGVVGVLSRMYDHTLGSWVVRTATSVVGVSQSACDFARHIGAGEPICVVNGVDAPKPSFKRPAVPVVLFVGRLIRAKGVQDLIAACATRGWGSRLLIAGDGPYRKQLEKQAAGCEHVEFLGEVGRGALRKLYSQASIFVNPSYSEGLPTAVLEAMSYGVPVVATDVGGTREIVQNNATGLLVSPHDPIVLRTAINWLFEHPQQALRMGHLGQEKVLREFSWDAIAGKYDGLLRSMCSRSG